MKRRLIVLVGALVCATNTNAENLIRWLINKGQSNNTHVQGLRKSQLGNTPFYVYRIDSNHKPVKSENKSVEHTPMTESEKETARIAIAQQQAEIQAQIDNKPIKRVIDTHRASDEVAAQSVSIEKRTVYGAGSPLRDDGVIAAWREAEEAQRRLEEHRSYMEQVRQARLRVEQTKRVSGDINQNP